MIYSTDLLAYWAAIWQVPDPTTARFIDLHDSYEAGRRRRFTLFQWCSILSEYLLVGSSDKIQA